MGRDGGGGDSRLRDGEQEVGSPVYLLLPTKLEAVERAVSQGGGYVVKLNLAAPRLAGGRNGAAFGLQIRRSLPPNAGKTGVAVLAESGPCLSWIGRRQEERFRGKAALFRARKAKATLQLCWRCNFQSGSGSHSYFYLGMEGMLLSVVVRRRGL